MLQVAPIEGTYENRDTQVLLDLTQHLICS